MGIYGRDLEARSAFEVGLLEKSIIQKEVCVRCCSPLSHTSASRGSLSVYEESERGEEVGDLVWGEQGGCMHQLFIFILMYVLLYRVCQGTKGNEERRWVTALHLFLILILTSFKSFHWSGTHFVIAFYCYV